MLRIGTTLTAVICTGNVFVLAALSDEELDRTAEAIKATAAAPVRR